MAGEAVLLDLPGLEFQGDVASFLRTTLRLSDRSRPSLLLVLCSPRDDGAAAAFKDFEVAGAPGFAPPLHVLQDESVARLFRLAKGHVDDLEIARVTVRTGGRRAPLMGAYAAEMFTPVYGVEVDADPGPEVASELTPAESAAMSADVEACFRELPALMGPVRILRSHLIPGERFLHGFSVRQGGVSTLPGMRSLNLLYSARRRDPPGAVAENRQRLAQAAGFPLESLLSIKVCHGATVWVVGREQPANYDGLVTARPGVTVAVPGADCAALLLVDPVRGACGAVHAGWRGTVGDIGGVAVRAMVAELGCSARDIRVVQGPSVGPCCFQVGPDVAAQFAAIDATCVRRVYDGTTNADLRRANRILLERSGVLPEHIDDGTAPGQHAPGAGVTLCTSCHPELFFSYRRGGLEYGTMLGFVMLRE